MVPNRIVRWRITWGQLWSSVTSRHLYISPASSVLVIVTVVLKQLPRTR